MNDHDKLHSDRKRRGPPTEPTRLEQVEDALHRLTKRMGKLNKEQKEIRAACENENEMLYRRIEWLEAYGPDDENPPRPDPDSPMMKAAAPVSEAPLKTDDWKAALYQKQARLQKQIEWLETYSADDEKPPRPDPDVPLGKNWKKTIRRKQASFGKSLPQMESYDDEKPPRPDPDTPLSDWKDALHQKQESLSKRLDRMKAYSPDDKPPRPDPD